MALVVQINTVGLHALAIALASAALCDRSANSGATAAIIAGDRWIHVVGSGESWTTIGARVGVDPEVLARRNARTVGIALTPGDVLGIDNRHIVPAFEEEGLLINLPQRMLFHYAQGVMRANYPVAVGQPDWPTPLGRFSIVAMETEPTWDVPLSIQEEMQRAGKPVVKRVAPGPANPLGRYWMGLSLGSVGLHGTTAPSSIYHFATHGCVRLHPDDVEDLFPFVGVGEHGQSSMNPFSSPSTERMSFSRLHPDRYHRSPNPLSRALAMIDQLQLRDLVELADVVRVVREAEGLAVPVHGSAVVQMPRRPRVPTGPRRQQTHPCWSKNSAPAARTSASCVYASDATGVHHSLMRELRRHSGCSVEDRKSERIRRAPHPCRCRRPAGWSCLE